MIFCVILGLLKCIQILFYGLPNFKLTGLCGEEELTKIANLFLDEPQDFICNSQNKNMEMNEQRFFKRHVNK